MGQSNVELEVPWSERQQEVLGNQRRVGGNRGGGKKPLCGLETESLRLEEALSSSMHPSAGAV